MTRPSLRRKNLSSQKDLNMSQRKHLLMVISHSITQFQHHGPVSKSQEGDTRDQTLVLMMMPSLRRNLLLLRDLNTFQKRLRSMVINHSTTLSQEDGPANKSQAGDLRDPTPVSMMKLSWKRANITTTSITKTKRSDHNTVTQYSVHFASTALSSLNI